MHSGWEGLKLRSRLHAALELQRLGQRGLQRLHDWRASETGGGTEDRQGGLRILEPLDQGSSAVPQKFPRASAGDPLDPHLGSNEVPREGSERREGWRATSLNLGH